LSTVSRFRLPLVRQGCAACPPRFRFAACACACACACGWYGSATTTPFDMVVRNDPDRQRLVMDVIDRVPASPCAQRRVRQPTENARLRRHDWIRVHGTDLPEVADWAWDG
jgi:hypothetical protein